jgi:hypothetical protein
MPKMLSRLRRGTAQPRRNGTFQNPRPYTVIPTAAFPSEKKEDAKWRDSSCTSRLSQLQEGEKLIAILPASKNEPVQ